jgi:hypothetical protein
MNPLLKATSALGVTTESTGDPDCFDGWTSCE